MDIIGFIGVDANFIFSYSYSLLLYLYHSVLVNEILDGSECGRLHWSG